ncbi:MAG: phosphoglycolate phosphatase [Candidatus Neomarinimicrobiota bacterium]|nr:HAD-IA family hydrolase [Candidatus Neomarinimicrobiota bacterium]RKY54607.1 MAG: phosphoglycolate phosphatase [Candidatus Neomarinimicrobiota bacterium]
MSRIEMIIFDLDGTLVNSFSDIAASVNETLDYFGCPLLEEKVVVQYIGDGVKMLIARSFGRSIFNNPDYEWPEEELNKYYKKYLEIYSQNLLNTTDLYPGVRETLGELRIYKKVILSNKNKSLTDRILRTVGIYEFFDFVFGGDSFSVRKPDPGPILSILEITGISANSAMIVGDSEKDIIAGKEAGIKTCAVTYGLRSYKELREYGPDLIVDDFRQLPGAIEGFPGRQDELSSPVRDR